MGVGGFTPSLISRLLHPKAYIRLGVELAGEQADKQRQALIGPSSRPGRYLGGQVPTSSRALCGHPAPGHGGAQALLFLLYSPQQGLPVQCLCLWGTNTSVTQQPGQGHGGTHWAGFGMQKVENWVGVREPRAQFSGWGSLGPPDSRFSGPNPGSATHQLSGLGQGGCIAQTLVFASVNWALPTSHGLPGGLKESIATKPLEIP